MLVVGSLLIGLAVGSMLWNDFGPGPLDVFIGAVRNVTGMPLTFAVWGVVGSLVAVAWVLGRRPGLGTIASPLLIGPTMQAALDQLSRWEEPSVLPAQLAVHAVAVSAVGVGAGLLIVSGLGAGSGELLAAATSDRFGRDEPRVRMAFEFGWLAIGVALGGPIGLGTVFVALTIGPAVARGTLLVEGSVVRSRRRIAAVAGAL